MTTTEQPETRRERAQRLSARHTVALAGTVVALALLALLAGLHWLGVTPSPFAREFSRTPTGVDALTPVCPPEGATPLPVDQVTVTVFNAAGAEGLAGSTAEQLGALGFTVAGAANWDDDSNVPAVVTAGPEGIAHGYTLALAVPGAIVVEDERAGTDVDLVLGENAPALATPETFATVPTDAFVAPQGCEPAS